VDGRKLRDVDIYLLRADGEPIDVFLYRREMLVTELRKRLAKVAGAITCGVG
jgi:hypothetical protein